MDMCILMTGCGTGKDNDQLWFELMVEKGFKTCCICDVKVAVLGIYAPNLKRLGKAQKESGSDYQYTENHEELVII